MVEMNTTPLIDVMLVLLTLLIITIPIQTHAVKLDMPHPNSTPPPVPPETVVIKVDFDGSVTWNGNTLATIATSWSPISRTRRQSRRSRKSISRSMLWPNMTGSPSVLADAQRIGATHIGFTGLDAYN